MNLRVLTWNIHKGIGGLDRRYKPERVCEVLSHHAPDLVLLQEVDEGARRSRRHRQVDLFADALAMRHRAWFPNVRVLGGGTYGNAVLSRYHQTEAVNIDLTIGRRKRRSVLHARHRVRFPCGSTRTVHVFNLHLGLAERERRQQLERFLDAHPFSGLHRRTPIVVAGDFNDVYGTLGKRLLEPAGFRGAGARLNTFPAWAPLRALDAIYVRGDVDLRRVFRPTLPAARRASDHLPLIAELELR